LDGVNGEQAGVPAGAGVAGGVVVGVCGERAVVIETAGVSGCTEFEGRGAVGDVARD
jgi:hypothetical protein